MPFSGLSSAPHFASMIGGTLPAAPPRSGGVFPAAPVPPLPAAAVGNSELVSVGAVGTDPAPPCPALAPVCPDPAPPCAPIPTADIGLAPTPAAPGLAGLSGAVEDPDPAWWSPLEHAAATAPMQTSEEMQMPRRHARRCFVAFEALRNMPSSF